MIVKELEPQFHPDPLRRAGYEAERQMAHYLRRAFGESPEVKVLHNLRLERAGEVAQLDHLLIHRHGVVIVESKSVTGQLSVNGRGEWARWWKGQGRGMPSPVLQARRQAEVLHALLKDHHEQLLGRRLLGRVQKGFGAMHLDVLVAVSDSGVIRGGPQVPREVLKADQIPDRVRELLGHYRKANRLLSLNFRDAGFEATEAEVMGIASFLKQRHVPAPSAAAPSATGPVAAAPAAAPATARSPRPAASPPGGAAAANASGPDASGSPVRTSQERQSQARPTPEVRCRACGSGDVVVLSGKYGYYLRCRACGGNTPAKAVCAECGQPGRVQKAGREFSAQCPGGHRWAYFSNPLDT